MFVGRHQELARLGALLGRKQAALAVVYGRRRIGKTELIHQALGSRETLWFDGLENRPKAEQVDAFLFQLEAQTGDSFRTSQRTWRWREVFLLLDRVVADRPRILVLDEFQWLANYRAEIVSDLKLIWDRYLSRRDGVHLILCGSIASFMQRKVVRSRALYGRASLILDIKPFALAESRSMLTGRGTNEVLEAQMMLGGVPQYLQVLQEHPSVRIGTDIEAFRAEGWLVGEYDRIFVSHFGRHPDYDRLVRALASHPRGLFRRELAALAEVDLGGTLTTHLEDLESAGFITAQRPIDKGPNSRVIKYVLSDAYLRFYFAFIRPNLKRIRSGAPGGSMFERIAASGAFAAWMGTAFEHVCSQHVARLSTILGFWGIDFTCGPYLRPKRGNTPGVQIDLLFDRADRVLTLCEMKYQRKPVGLEVIAEVERRAERLEQAFPGRTIHKVLIVNDSVTRDLEASLAFYRIIRAEELFG